MDYEKLYKEALERATKAKNNASLSNGTLRVLGIIFPELKESEDERIRKELIRLVYVSYNDLFPYTPTKEEYEEMTAWLEKQGEKTQQTPRWMIKFLDENRVKFASLMDDYADQREVEGKLLAIIDWLEKQGEKIK